MAKLWIQALFRAIRRFPQTVAGEVDTLRWEAMKRASLARLEAEAVRTFDGPNGRLYEMPGGGLMRWQGWLPLPVSHEDAEDYFGWTGRRRQR